MRFSIAVGSPGGIFAGGGRRSAAGTGCAFGHGSIRVTFTDVTRAANASRVASTPSSAALARTASASSIARIVGTPFDNPEVKIGLRPLATHGRHTPGCLARGYFGKRTRVLPERSTS